MIYLIFMVTEYYEKEPKLIIYTKWTTKMLLIHILYEFIFRRLMDCRMTEECSHHVFICDFNICNHKMSYPQFPWKQE